MILLIWYSLYLKTSLCAIRFDSNKHLKSLMSVGTMIKGLNFKISICGAMCKTEEAMVHEVFVV